MSLIDYLQVTWTGKGAVPASGSVLWSVLLRTVEGASRKLGYELVDDRFSAQFVKDVEAGWQEDYADDVAIEGDALVARFPLSALDGLGDEWTWQAILLVNGHDASVPR